MAFSSYNPINAFNPLNPFNPMTKSDDKKLQALAKKNAAKIAKPSKDNTSNPAYDSTLRIKRDEEGESKTLFKEMKKREF
jgi:hypothetical protein